MNTTFDDNPEMARVAAEQQLLFPANPRAVCEQMGLNWWAALKLHEDGWLSYSPANTPRLDEAQEAELRFIGSLVMAGCDRGMLAILLSRLSKPYAYDAARLYYDWSARRWRLLPDPHAHPEAIFTDWLDSLVTRRGQLADRHPRARPGCPVPGARGDLASRVRSAGLSGSHGRSAREAEPLKESGCQHVQR